MSPTTTAARAVGRPKRRARPSLLASPTFRRVASVTATILLWEWVGRGVDAIFFSYPSAIIAVLPQMLESGDLQKAIGQSLPGFVTGFAMAIVFGVIVGLVMGRYRLIDHLLDAQLSALYSTPNVALVPLLILWFGLGVESKIAIIFYAAFFPIVVNTYGGVRNVSRTFVEIAQVERAREPQIFMKVIMPAALPFIMTGIRLSVGRAVVGMVVAEFFTAVTGLGGAIVYYGNQFRTDKLLVVVILLALLGVTLTEVAKTLERRLSPWKESERAS